VPCKKSRLIHVDTVTHYQGSGTWLNTITKSYSVLTSPPEGSGFVILPQADTTTIPNGSSSLASEVWQGYDGGFTFTDYYGNSYTVPYGLVTEEMHYDWGSGSPGPMLSDLWIGYYYPVDSNYLSANLLALPYWRAVVDGSWNTCAGDAFWYDTSAAVSSGVTAQHWSAPYSVRGNLTQTARWYLSGGSCGPNSGNYTASTTYRHVYDTGMVQQTIDPLNHTTTYEYANQNPNWYGSRVTKITNALNQSTNYGYDWPSGLLTYSQDVNGIWTN
jgi:hypothetical protein